MAGDRGQGSDRDIVQGFSTTDGQCRGRDRPLAKSGALPVDYQPVASTVVEVGHDQRVGTGRKVDRPGLLDHPVQAVIVDDQFLADVDPRTVVRSGEEGVATGLGDVDRPGESQGEPVVLLLLWDVLLDGRHDAAPLGGHGGQRFNGDVLAAGEEVVDLDALLHQSRSGLFGFQRCGQFDSQGLDLVVEISTEPGVGDGRDGVEEVPETSLAGRGGQQRVITGAV